MNRSPSQFDDQFFQNFSDLLVLRRDVRRFRRDPLPKEMLRELIGLASLAPSVGFSQCWRWIQVDAPERRAAILENYRACNARALDDFSGDRATLYARLKLAGLIEAPVHLAVFVDPETSAGHGLGIRTMPEMLAYSAVCAVHTLWLLTRARGIGMGWVSILDPVLVNRTLDVPATWKLIAYLCLGYPESEANRPELEVEGWESHKPEWSVPVQR